MSGAGLALIAAGGAALAWGIARELKSARAQGRRAGVGARAGLAVLSCAALFLAAEIGAWAAIRALGLGGEIAEFRRRQLFEGEPLKVPHPFLIMTNNPRMEGVNSLGFHDKEWTREKPAGRFRIACLGASTTEDGFPALMETAIKITRPLLDVEAMNFGNSGWTSAQSLINYSLNVAHFSPDVVILHDAANEAKTRGFGDFRTDYSHAFKPLAAPAPRADAFAIRRSDAYALAKWSRLRGVGANAGISVYDAIMRPNERPVGMNDFEIQVFRRNMSSMAALAARDGAKVLVATMPHSKAHVEWGTHVPSHMEQANGALREVAAEGGHALADLDREMTGREELFIDPVHLTQEGVKMKAKALAKAVEPFLPAGGAGR